MKKLYKNILILILELGLCIFAIANCISHLINHTDGISKGTSVFDLVAYFILAGFFIIVFIKNKK